MQTLWHSECIIPSFSHDIVLVLVHDENLFKENSNVVLNVFFSEVGIIYSIIGGIDSWIKYQGGIDREGIVREGIVHGRNSVGGNNRGRIIREGIVRGGIARGGK